MRVYNTLSALTKVRWSVTTNREFNSLTASGFDQTEVIGNGYAVMEMKGRILLASSILRVTMNVDEGTIT